MTSVKFSTVLMATFLSASVGAATQGTLGATSTGSYTNTFGDVSARQVQILNLSDAVVTNSSPNVIESLDGSLLTPRPGVEDNFCVVDTTGGAVRLTFTGQTTGDFWEAISTDGSSIPTFINFMVPSRRETQKRITQTNMIYDVPPGISVTTSAGCGAGNMTKIATLGDPVPAGKTYSTVVTIVASPV